MSVGKWVDLETNGWDNGLEISPINNDMTFDQTVHMYWMTPTFPNMGNSGNWYHTFTRPGNTDALVTQALTSQPGSPDDIAADQGIVKNFYDDATVIPLWEGPMVIVLQKYVQDLGWGDDVAKGLSGAWNYSGAWLDK